MPKWILKKVGSPIMGPIGKHHRAEAIFQEQAPEKLFRNQITRLKISEWDPKRNLLKGTRMPKKLFQMIVKKDVVISWVKAK